MRILVIEDEPRILAFVTRALEAEGFTVDGVSNGVEGLRAALEEPYRLLVLDLLLPGIGGLALLRRVKAAKPELPVLILSARSGLRTKLRGFDLGATDYLTKPFSLDELVARVRVQVQRSATGAGTVLQRGPFELDVTRRQASLRGVVFDLTDREFRLLHYLATCDGEVVSRERLLAEVWGIDFDPRTNVVDVCVRRLRQKLGSETPIETVRHEGYRFSSP